jgi:magnesium and cobalt transporter
LSNKNDFLKKIFKKRKYEDDETTLWQSIKNVEENLNEYDKKMVFNILELKEITVKEIMVPRVDVVSINIKSEIDEIIKCVDECGRSRLPVYDDNLDNIVGILHAKDLLKYFIKKQGFDITKIIREPFFVPESKNIRDMLVELREKKTHIAIIVDEYGGMAGIVCFEDILERIVGEIQDEFDKEVDEFIKIEENKFLVDPRISLTELNSRLGSEFEEEEIDTLGGLIFMIFGRIPNKNDKIEYKNYLFTIESISGRKIKKVKIETLQLNEISENET